METYVIILDSSIPYEWIDSEILYAGNDIEKTNVMLEYCRKTYKTTMCFKVFTVTLQTWMNGKLISEDSNKL